MSKVAIKGNPLGTGTFTIEAPNSDTNSTIVLPVGGGSVVLTDATQTLTNKSISASQVNSGTLDSARIPDLAATKITSGTFDAARIPDLAASKITSGTIATARLASGTANSTTFLRGDQTWQTISTTPTTDQVLSAYAGAGHGAVGTYTIAFSPLIAHNTDLAPGSTTAASNLRRHFTQVSSSVAGYGMVQDATVISAGLTGTWRLMMALRNVDGEGESRRAGGLWLRIS